MGSDECWGIDLIKRGLGTLYRPENRSGLAVGLFPLTAERVMSYETGLATVGERTRRREMIQVHFDELFLILQDFASPHPKWSLIDRAVINGSLFSNFLIADTFDNFHQI
jgi:hypothetical protein